MSTSTTQSSIAEASTAEATAHPPNTGKLAAASSIGTALEWYDFTVYNIMAALIFNHVFFPSFDPLVGTILAFSTYAWVMFRGRLAVSSLVIWVTCWDAVLYW
ncbi:Inner membrane metabolite transport protein yhjE [Serratia quinivorans]|nr:Inner membrane metabolite transport protein yhjE [Serratia quinivorans]